MPTTITAFVNTASSGGDGTTNNTSGGTAAYASLHACLLARGKNLVTADEILLVKCTGTTADSTAVVAADWAAFVCDATRYIQIEPNTGQEHGGAWNTNVYRLDLNDLTPVNGPTTAAVLFKILWRGIQMRMNATTGSTNRQCVSLAAGVSTSSTWDMQKCLFRTSKSGGTGTSHKGITIADTQWSPVYLGDCLFIGEGTPGGQAVHRNATGNVYVHNCGVVGFAEAYTDAQNSTTGTLQLKNNWAYQCTTFSSGAGVENSDYNSTDLASASGGANDRVSQTFTFVNAAGGDYRPANDDTAIRGQGTDLSADGNLPITVDMNGDPVNSPPDIGPLIAEAAEEPPASDNRWRLRRAAA